ncbi:hypothetical protein SAMN05421676_108140 [Salinibacillus kushneri]|uniref:Uncharacterized protein n=1 Tax=Salinibacillus kushneri TaxID=237682 RepID=A0A1I0HAV1_9BACI|nr:hypothetical protein SAMN05421676_108140 [Salinibacillus kushneri]
MIDDLLNYTFEKTIVGTLILNKLEILYSKDDYELMQHVIDEYKSLFSLLNETKLKTKFFLIEGNMHSV